MSTPVEYQRLKEQHRLAMVGASQALIDVTSELADIKCRIAALANEWERRCDAIAITYQNPDHRAIATGPTRVAIRQLRALLDEERA